MYQERLDFLVVIYLSHNKKTKDRKKKRENLKGAEMVENQTRNAWCFHSCDLININNRFYPSVAFWHKRVFVSSTTGASVLVLFNAKCVVLISFVLWIDNCFKYMFDILNMRRVFLLMPYTRPITLEPWILVFTERNAIILTAFHI